MKTPNTLVVHLWLLARPIVAGALSALIWYVIAYRMGQHIHEADESAFTDTLMPIVAMFHAILATSVLSKVWDEYKLVGKYIREGDRAAFRECMYDRIPIAIHMLLAAMSLFLEVATLRLHFEGVWDGLFCSFSVSFVLALYWEVATNLDNPQKGVWYVGRIPADWLEEEIKEKAA